MLFVRVARLPARASPGLAKVSSDDILHRPVNINSVRLGTGLLTISIIRRSLDMVDYKPSYRRSGRDKLQTELLPHCG